MDKILKIKVLRSAMPIALILLMLGFGTGIIFKSNQVEEIEDNNLIAGSITINNELEGFDEKAKDLPTDTSELNSDIETDDTDLEDDSNTSTTDHLQSNVITNTSSQKIPTYTTITAPINPPTISATPQINYSSLSGLNLKIEEGTLFNPLTDLKIKATDRNGANITNSVQLSGAVDVNRSGVYSITAKVKLSDNTELVQTFYVEVLAKPLVVNIKNVQLSQQNIELDKSVSLKFNVESSKHDISPVAATINGIKYPVNKIVNNQFEVELPGMDVGGKQTITLNSIEMNDGTTILVNQKQDLTVLKPLPLLTKTIERLNSQTGVMEVGFEIVDEQLAINHNKSIVIALYDENDNQVYKVSHNISTLGHFLITIPKNGEYTLKVFGYMNRDYTNSYELTELYAESLNITGIDKSSLTGNSISLKEGQEFDPIKDLQLKATNEDGEDITSSIQIEHSVNTQVPGTYEVRATITKNNGDIISQVYTVKVTAVKTELKVNRFETMETNTNLGSNVTLELDVSLSKDYLEVDSVEIDGNNYSVQKINNQIYQVTIPALQSSGQYELNLSKVILSNQEEFVVNNKCQVTVTRIVTYSEPVGLMLTEETMTRSAVSNVTQRTIQGQVTGSDLGTYSSDLNIEGQVLNSNNQAPEGQISVTLPTTVSFIVNADGDVTAANQNFEIVNNSQCDVKVKVSNFTDSTPIDGSGITIVDVNDLNGKDRSYVSLTLLTQSGGSGQQVTLKSNGFTSQELGTVVGGATTGLTLVGQAGDATQDSDVTKKGLTDTFTLTFTISKN